MTRTVLHMDTSARRQDSVTRDLSQRIVTRMGADRVIRRDLADTPPLIGAEWIGANFTPRDQRSPEQQQKLALSDSLVEELRQADVLVIGLPIYNFGVPAAFKAWFDLVARAGDTFRYTEAGPEGLLRGKRAVLAMASGGTQVGSEADFASTYARHALGFIGIKDVEVIAADRMAVDPEASLLAAHAAVRELAA